MSQGKPKGSCRGEEAPSCQLGSHRIPLLSPFTDFPLLSLVSCLLQEMWNCPYSNDSFPTFAEEISAPEFSASPSAAMLASVAKDKGLIIVGGSIPERRDGKLFNTSLVFGRDGSLKGKFSKVPCTLHSAIVPLHASQGPVQVYLFGVGMFWAPDVVDTLAYFMLMLPLSFCCRFTCLTLTFRGR